MTRALYVTHPQVEMDPDVPVPRWGLSAEGRHRAEAFARSGVVPPGAKVFASDERKAMELAVLIALAAGTEFASDHRMGENDRSATGFLPPPLFEATADRFFAQPEESADGWERAIDAQRRIVDAVGRALANVPSGTHAIFCGHGAVGTLLKCHLANRPISRREDQHHAGPGGGNCFVFDTDSPKLHTDWMRMEDLSPGWMC
ncbi:histidine phosphatase family protein [Devosia sp. RR2S18]|uniref:histidine phosphatase family protein n=1 Tax=Devosia rhizosphaerae TaxID=3049774 RepID=UPI0025407F27|nr:histidine phosphatase family protein [Devosia sp. RR2S18]WIJ25366.1 histidine phosphatase family protein [Devosia sp. RR2S18]